ncbi:MAG TPA: serine hydrolase [Lachnospiraceae bacterium]|nr:serine hydrolase [Lachnospiraceae bacterium]
MTSYHFRQEKKFRRRRLILATTTLICIIVLAIAGYLFFNKDNSTEVSTAATSVKPASSIDVPVDTKEGASSTSINKSGVNTKDHGYLPKYDTITDSGKMKDLEKLITDYTKKLPGKYGVSFIDLATGEMVNVNDKIEYVAASTSKLPINMVLYMNVEAGKVKMDDMLTYQKEDFELGTGSIISSAFGTKYTVREASKRSIQQSDNCGVNMIIRLVGLENVRSYIDQVGGQVHYDKAHRSCPYDMAQVSKDLYIHYLNNEAVYGELIGYMESTLWHDRIDANLPRTVKVAHKIGNQKTTRNDVGIVFASHPYVLSIMSDNVNVDAATTSIAGLSKEIYDFVESYAN